MAARKTKDDDTAVGLHGYPITRFQGPGGKHDIVDVSSAVQEHNLRAAGYVPAKGDTPTDTEKMEAAEAHTPDVTPATTTRTTR